MSHGKSIAVLGNDDFTVDSVLVADFGHLSSRAFLFEKIAGAFRFVGQAASPTSLAPPHNDLPLAWLAALRQLGHQTGRSLDTDGRLRTPQANRGDGVDAMLVCSSLGEPLRVALIDTGVTPMSTAIGSALRRAHARILHERAPSGRKDEGWIVAPSERLESFQPEQVILLLDGDTSYAAPRAVELVRRMDTFMSPADAVICGPARLLAQIHGLFVPPTKIRTMSSDDVEPENLASQIERETAQLWTERIGREDVDRVFGDAASAPMTKSAAFGRATTLIAREAGSTVLSVAIDEGSDMHLANGDDRSSITLPRLDLSNGLTSLSSADITGARRWLPFEIGERELLVWALNRSVRPRAISFDAQDLRIEQALARPILKALVHALTTGNHDSVSTAGTIVISGQPAHWNDPGGAVLAVLDALDHVPETGMVELAIDYDGLITAIGTISANDPDLAADVLKRDALSPLGSALVLSGAVKRGETVCELEIERPGNAPEMVAINGGELVAYPLSAGQTATIKVKPARKVAIGAHPAGKAITFSDARPAVGGEIGLIVDARGRPLLEAASAIDPGSIQRWLDALGSEPSAA